MLLSELRGIFFSTIDQVEEEEWMGNDYSSQGKFGVSEACCCRQTNTQTDTLITILLRTPQYRGGCSKCLFDTFSAGLYTHATCTVGGVA